MAKNQNPDELSSPDDLAPTTPRDLYATFDIRFVMLKIGDLSSKVDRLIDDVKSQGGKIDGLRLTFAWASGVVVATVFFLSVAARIIPIPHITFDIPAPTQDAPKK